MKKIQIILLLAVVLAAVYVCRPTEKTLVILSTTDVHAQIDQVPKLAAAIRACRDTVPDVILLDAGDRWTGNPYVDRTEMRGLPIIQLMNRLGYDAGTFGNHEFDFGQAALGRMLDSIRFPLVCANLESDTCTFDQAKIAKYTILERKGIRIGVVGAVTNYEGPGHPAGHHSSFVGLRFPDPMEQASACADTLREQVDILVLLSHMGDDRDSMLLEKESRFDLVVSGHTHELRNQIINGTKITQSGKYLNYIGVTKIRLRNNKIREISYENIPLNNYEPDPEFAEAVAQYNNNPELNAAIGEFDEGANRFGIGQWINRLMMERTHSDIGIYHYGGIRRDSLPAGSVGRATIYQLEPFNTEVVVMNARPDDLRRIIIAKFNDQDNIKESHRIDLIASTPYTILIDPETKDAVNVIFPELDERRTYRVAFNNYISKNYNEVDREHTTPTGDLVTRYMFDAFSKHPTQHLENQALQKIEPAEMLQPRPLPQPNKIVVDL